MNLCKIGDLIKVKGYMPTWTVTNVIKLVNGTFRIYAETHDKYGKVEIIMTDEEFAESCTVVTTEGDMNNE